MSAHRRDRSKGWDDETSLRGFRSADAEGEMLVDLASIAVGSEDPKQAALACLECCSAALGAASGFVALASSTDEPAAARLEIAAMVGPHVPLLGDSARIAADEQTEVAVAFTTGEPRFVGSRYDGSEDAADGTARWRGLISAQATALLPLSTSARGYGVMMLEWQQAQHFGEETRRSLVAAAQLTALAVERALPAATGESGPARTRGTEPPVVVGRTPLVVNEKLEPGIVPVVPAVTSPESLLRFELTAEGLVLPRAGEEEWANGPVRITIPATPYGGSLVDVHPVGSGRVLLGVVAVNGATGARQEELTEMLRHTLRVLSGRAQAVAVLDEAAARLLEFGGATVSLEGWIGVLDAVNGSLSHAQSGRAGSRMLVGDGRDFEGSPDAPSTWLPLAGDILHAWIPGAASVRAEWR